MGWTLSETAKNKIDTRIEDIIQVQDGEFERLKALLQPTSTVAIDGHGKAVVVNK